MNRQQPPGKRFLFWSVVVIALTGFWMANRPSDRKSPAASAPDTSATSTVSPTASAPPSEVELERRSAPFASFHARPFAVAQETDNYAWTAEDGKDPGVIRQLAHNELEFQRLAEETARIYRRQLVYAKETADFLVQKSRLTGEPIRQISLPGLDGAQYLCNITASDLSPSGQQGTFAGHVAGKLDSLVTFAFKGGREAFTVMSPSDNTYLIGEPREPGELIVKSINPATYVPGVCGNP